MSKLTTKCMAMQTLCEQRVQLAVHAFLFKFWLQAIDEFQRCRYNNQRSNSYGIRKNRHFAAIISGFQSTWYNNHAQKLQAVVKHALLAPPATMHILSGDKRQAYRWHWLLIPSEFPTLINTYNNNAVRDKYTSLHPFTAFIQNNFQ